MSKFKKRRGIKLSYNRQAFLFYACLTAHVQKPAVENAIKAALTEMGVYGDVIYDSEIGGLGVRRAAEKNHYSESTVYEQRNKFYELLAKKLFTD